MQPTLRLPRHLTAVPLFTAVPRRTGVLMLGLLACSAFVAISVEVASVVYFHGSHVHVKPWQAANDAAGSLGSAVGASPSDGRTQVVSTTINRGLVGVASADSAAAVGTASTTGGATLSQADHAYLRGGAAGAARRL